ncbi:hypothetical protein [Pseudomonas aeruginosa]|uniref:hypothetical protein n=1 Tax=Pseudomonas aeruginosa TaxID=287 RepID=UPI00071B8717|nr:hypothetical protein [Pseudomonas aeruginosa]KSH76537.1 hypothetical protein AO974_14040 [Pseudomonas aeruginosa]KSH94441.1 hypothetical protein AO975_14125 [Pseudomonas aeruginosa]MBA5035836.1 hypothetical protein [Pseudomonas aeruginosa]HCE7950021.1 hypothetical protein [Pseudomonas aeruginosa]HCE9929444.1 hypothetical protein [Pseudomonas aeruginosa]
MSGWLLRLTGAGLLILLGMAVGIWATTSHFRPLLDDQRDLATQCTAARDNLAGLAQEQGKALGDLTLAANGRQARAAQAVDEATASAKGDFAAANRLQQERTGGDQCAAAEAVIDKELGL